MAKTIKKRKVNAPVIIQIGRGKQDKHNYKMKLAEKQNFICPVCKRDFSQDKTKDLHLDHNHKNGMVRQTLCGGCNRAEGRLAGIIRRFLSRVEIDFAEWATNLVEYWEYHDENPSNVLHPDYLTDFDKKEKTRIKSRKRRENAKKNKTI